MMDQSNDAVIVMSVNSMSLSQVGGITSKLANPVESVIQPLKETPKVNDLEHQDTIVRQTSTGPPL